MTQGLAATRVVAPANNTHLISIQSIRTDGQTQHRTAINQELIRKYAELMSEGAVFPPVRVWWDGTDYWLTDGFHRLGAAQRLEMQEILAEVHIGALSAAQWDSYAANCSHGARRTRAEAQNVLRLALHHSNAEYVSNLELARHLQLPESTVRRWRRAISSSSGEVSCRLVTRRGTTYQLTVDKIGRHRAISRLKRRDDIRAELAAMKDHASPELRRLLNIVGNWVLGTATPVECVAAMEHVVSAGLHLHSAQPVRG